MKTTIFLLLLASTGRIYLVDGKPVEAEFVMFTDNKVLLESQEGYLYLHPSRLSSADRKHYQTKLRQDFQSKLDTRSQFSQNFRMRKYDSRYIRRQNEYIRAQRRLDWSLSQRRWEFERIFRPLY